MPSPFCCLTCPRSFPTAAGLQRHRAHSKICHELFRQSLCRRIEGGHPPGEFDQLGGSHEVEHRGYEDVHEQDAEVEELEDRVSVEGNAQARNHAPTVQDEDEDEDIYIREFPAQKQAGKTYGTAPTSFDSISNLREEGTLPWGPFQSKEEWELARWLVKNAGHNQTDAFLRLPIVSLCPSSPSRKAER